MKLHLPKTLRTALAAVAAALPVATTVSTGVLAFGSSAFAEGVGTDPQTPAPQTYPVEVPTGNYNLANNIPAGATDIDTVQLNNSGSANVTFTGNAPEFYGTISLDAQSWNCFNGTWNFGSSDGVYTSVDLHGSGNGMAVGDYTTEAGALNIGNLSGVAGTHLSAAYGTTGSATSPYTHYIAVHQTKDTTFAGVADADNGYRKIGILKYGTGNLILSGTNASTGDLKVYEGTLTLSGDSAAWAGAITISKNGTLAVSGLTNAKTYNMSKFAGTGTVDFTTPTNDNLTLNLSANDTFAGTLVVNNSKDRFVILHNSNTYTEGKDLYHLVVNGASDNTDETAKAKGLVWETGGLEFHVASLSGNSNARITGSNGASSGRRALIVHQDVDTTFDGVFVKSGESGKSGERSVGLDKYGTGDLKLTAHNYSIQTLNIYEGSITLSGNGEWDGAITVTESGTLGFDGTRTLSKDITFETGATLRSGSAKTVGDLTLQGTREITNIVVLGGSTLTIDADASLTIGNTMIIGEGGSVVVNGTLKVDTIGSLELLGITTSNPPVYKDTTAGDTGNGYLQGAQLRALYKGIDGGTAGSLNISSIVCGEDTYAVDTNGHITVAGDAIMSGKYYINTGEVNYGGDDNLAASADTNEVVLNGGKIVLSTAIATPLTVAAASSVEIGKGVTFDHDSATGISSTNAVQLSGSGTYVNGTRLSGTNFVLAEGVTLADDWTGTVQLEYSESTSGVNALNFSALGHSGSAIELKGVGAAVPANSNFYLANGHSVDADIVMTGVGEDNIGLKLNNGNSSDTYTFSGAWTGTGDLVFNPSNNVTATFKFLGNMSGFEGGIISSAESKMRFGDGSASGLAEGKSVSGTGIIKGSNSGRIPNVFYKYSDDVIAANVFAGDVNISNEGTGRLTLTGASTGNINIKDGLVDVSGSTTGTLKVAGGTVALTGTSATNVNVTSGSLTVATGSTTGTLTVAGGTADVSNSVGNMSVTGGSATVSGTAANVTVTGGSATVSGTVNNLTVEGGAISLTGTGTRVTGNLTAQTTNGGIVLNAADANVTVGMMQALNRGSITVADGIVNSDKVMVHNSGTNTTDEHIDVTGGVLNVTSTATTLDNKAGIIIAHWHRGQNVSGVDQTNHALNVSGGVLNAVDCSTIVAHDSRGFLNISGGEANLYSIGVNSNKNQGGKVTLSGGRLNVGAGGVSTKFEGTWFDVSGDAIIGTLTDDEAGWSTNDKLTINASGNFTVDTSVREASTTGASSAKVVDDAAVAGKITFNGALTGSGNLKKVGAGTLVLAGSLDGYTGSVTVESGNLGLDGTYSLASSKLTLGADATITMGESGRLSSDGVTYSDGAVIKNTATAAKGVSLWGDGKASCATAIKGGSISIDGSTDANQNGNRDVRAAIDGSAVTFNGTGKLNLSPLTGNVQKLSSLTTAEGVTTAKLEVDGKVDVTGSLSGFAGVTVKDGKSLTAGSTVLDTNGTITVEKNATFISSGEAVTSFDASNSATIASSADNTVVSVTSSNLTYTNALVDVKNADTVGTIAATLNNSKVVNNDATADSDVEISAGALAGGTTELDAAKGDITVSNVGNTGVTVAALTVASERTFTASDADDAIANVTVAGDANVAGTVLANVTVNGNFNAKAGAQVNGLALGENGTLTLNAVNTDALTVASDLNVSLDKVVFSDDLKTAVQAALGSVTETTSVVLINAADGTATVTGTMTSAEIATAFGLAPADNVTYSFGAVKGAQEAGGYALTDKNSWGITATVASAAPAGTLTANAVVGTGSQTALDMTAGTLTIQLNVTADEIAAASGLAITITDWEAIAGDDKAGLVSLALVDCAGGTVTYDPASFPVSINGYVGESNGKYDIQFIPEPATATLGLLALAGLAARRRRKH